MKSVFTNSIRYRDLLWLTCVLIFALACVSLALAEGWDEDNDPSGISGSYEYRLDQLPTHASLERLPWSDTYWPFRKGGIDNRWNQQNPTGFYYSTYSLAALRSMSGDEIAKLSPAEKYDILMGHYDYPLQAEVARRVNPRDPAWAGYCDGWSIAALQFEEPRPVEVVSPDGIRIPFGSSDIKALLTYGAFRDYPFNEGVGQIGRPCNEGERTYGGSGCNVNDVNPGALHVFLANELGLRRHGVIADVDPGDEIWNQPVYGFDYEIVGSASPDVGVSGVEVKATLSYTDELEDPKWNPVLKTADFRSAKMELDYVLDLDASGKIIGGRYLTRSHPDNLWIPVIPFDVEKEMPGMKQLLRR